MNYEMTGTVKLVEATKYYGANDFAKREFVVETDEEYSQDVKLEVVKEKCETLDNIKAGDAVSVKFRIRGNEYKDRYFVNLSAYFITVTSKATTPEPVAESLTFPEPGSDLPTDDLESLPF